MKTQEEFLKEILELKAANPDNELKFCVDCDTLDSDYTWMVQKIYKVEVSPWYQEDETIYTGDDDIKELFENQILDDDKTFIEIAEENTETMTRRIDSMVEKRYAEEVVEVICVFMTA